jgi:PAS domain S-box-containing protein
MPNSTTRQSATLLIPGLSLGKIKTLVLFEQLCVTPKVMVQNADRPGAESFQPDFFVHPDPVLLNEILELQGFIAQLQAQNATLQATETALHERESQFQVLVENSQDIIYTQSTTGTIEYIGPSIKPVLGRDAADFLGRSVLDFVHEEDVLRLRQTFEQMQATGEPRQGLLMRLQHQDRSYRWLSVNLTPIREADGAISAYQGVARNITERVEFEAERRKIQDHVRSTHAFLKNILNHIPDPIFVQDNQGKFVLVNEAMCELLGLILPEIIGCFSHDVLPPDIARQSLKNNQLALETGLPQTCEVLYPHRDGTQRFLSIKRSVYTTPTSDQFIIGSIRDLTDHRSTEARLNAMQIQLIHNEKMSALGMMIAGIAHEIKNPLNFIGGNLFPLEQSIGALFCFIDVYQQAVATPSPALQAVIDSGEIGFLQEDLPKLLTSMNLGVDRMQEIVQSLQTFARNDTDAKQWADLHEGINSTLLILKPRLKACGDRPEITIDRHYGELPCLECYPGQLNQVFMNLLGNAIDAIEETLAHLPHRPDHATWTPQIRITTQVLASGDLQIQITDNGCGLSSENQARLLKQAFTTKPIGKGTGLGMSISHQIITDRHQGQLLFTSEPDVGTTFSLILPTL